MNGRKKMTAVLQILTGLVAGVTGIFQIPRNPYAGFAAAACAGVLILEGLNRLLADGV
jgi:hypothetical protein